MIVAFTGIRDISPAMVDIVELAVLEEIGMGATELRFGGAEGADTMALRAACHADVPCVAYVPFTVAAQPRTARDAIRACATGVVELGLQRGDRGAWHARNRAMVDGADRVVAFSDGRETGGTAYTAEYAADGGLSLDVYPVRADRSGLRPNPQLQLREGQFSAPVFTLSGYMARPYGEDELSDIIRRNKAYEATPGELADLANDLERFIASEPLLAEATAIVAMPRHLPRKRSDMATLATSIGLGRGLEVAQLERTEQPRGGRLVAWRQRFSADEHARTMRYDGPGGKVIVLDNVVTTGQTLEGAFRAVRRAGAEPVGLAVLYSEGFSDPL